MRLEYKIPLLSENVWWKKISPKMKQNVIYTIDHKNKQRYKTNAENQENWDREKT